MPDDDLTEPDTDYTFVLEEPPERTSPNDPTGGPIVRNMRKAAEHPGQWARVASYPTSRAASLTLSKLKAGRIAARRPPGVWEFERGEVDGMIAIYARLVAPAE